MSSGTGEAPEFDSAADARVRRELAEFGSDPGAGPDIPPEVSARIGAALRTAGGAHTVTRPALSRTQRIALALGIAAAAVATVIGARMLTHDPVPMFPPGPTASQITVGTAHPPFPLSEAELRTRLQAPADLGPLADARRRTACLGALGYPPGTDVLGGTQLEVLGRPTVLVLIAGTAPGEVTALTVDSGCSAADSGLLAQTTFTR
ncbi:hypothetical protein [Mycolicibacterium parafortuitum]|uniref:Anti-sigma-M factor RsmA n=1 Tax=Mycolicibacterium parafortuitum TaxID=39692 RepID=A0A375YDS3_MYCPF|nr:hypothetical protein [Mycolicibacterium parafortuitum]ORB31165.1 hypothetical protein BST38_07665 [Mycolicibacterium parafortuitum]SRX79208.1 Anti-sigma-M factor RsmA [Mycolicibacterium parafortuitum]